MKKRVVSYGEAGKNRAKVTEEELNVDERANHTASLLRMAGKVYEPIGATYLGSAVVHYYSKELLASNPEFSVMCQCTGMSNVVENHADVGHKQLRVALMTCYGRKPPKMRGDS